MSTSFIKVVFLTLFAVLFGAGQFCACASVQPQEAGFAHTAHPAKHNTPSHSVSAEHSTAPAHSPGNVHGAAPCDEDRTHACSDCEENIEFVPASGSANIQSIDSAQPQPKLALAANTAIVRAVFTPSAPVGLRWLDPPRTLSTPVSLNTRLLI